MAMSRIEMQDLLVRFCQRNPEYRAALLRRPREVISAQFGLSLPDDLEVGVIEESARTVYVIVPHRPPEGGELSDDDLEAVAGGSKTKGDENCPGGTLSTVVETNVSLF